MPKAAPTNTTTPQTARTAGTRPDLSILPSVFEIGQQMKLLRDEIDRLDNAQLRLPSTMEAWAPGGRHDLEAAQGLAEDREDALRDLIATIPARDIKDAAVQLHAAWDCLSRLSDLFDVEYRRLDRTLMSVIPVVAAAAGIDLDQLGVFIGDYSRRAFAISTEEAGA